MTKWTNGLGKKTLRTLEQRTRFMNHLRVAQWLIRLVVSQTALFCLQRFSSRVDRRMSFVSTPGDNDHASVRIVEGVAAISAEKSRT